MYSYVNYIDTSELAFFMSQDFVEFVEIEVKAGDRRLDCHQEILIYTYVISHFYLLIL